MENNRHVLLQMTDSRDRPKCGPYDNVALHPHNKEGVLGTPFSIYSLDSQVELKSRWGHNPMEIAYEYGLTFMSNSLSNCVYIKDLILLGDRVAHVPGSWSCGNARNGNKITSGI